MAAATKSDLAQGLRRIPEKFIGTEVDSELILIHGDSGAFYSLTDVGLDIWKQIETAKSLSDISRDIVREYEISSGECEDAVLRFADELVAAGLAEYT